MRVYQVRMYQDRMLYSSSIKCPATIYLNSPSSNRSTAARHSEPFFLRTQYAANIYDETISKVMPILKVEAVTTNSSIHSPLIYTLINERDRFIIDSAQGFIYPRSDLTLDSGVYSLKVYLYL